MGKISKSRKGPDDTIPQQERVPDAGDRGLMTTAKPTAGYVDYETDSGQEFQVTQAASGHGSFMYPSTTKGKKYGEDLE
jgi:hypothetical protein